MSLRDIDLRRFEPCMCGAMDCPQCYPGCEPDGYPDDGADADAWPDEDAVAGVVEEILAIIMGDTGRPLTMERAVAARDRVRELFEVPEHFGDRLKRFRAENALTVPATAGLLGVSETAVNGYEARLFLPIPKWGSFHTLVDGTVLWRGDFEERRIHKIHKLRRQLERMRNEK